MGPWRQTSPAPHAGHDTGGRIAERAALGALAAFTIAALVGFSVFGRHPELLTRLPGAQPMYAMAFTFFARVQVVLAFLALAVALGRAAGTRWLLAFAACYVVSLASELSGTSSGLPFGPYHYTDGLGVKWFAHVPLLIPVSWFMMAVPSLALALPVRRSLHTTRGRLATIGLGALVLLSWDLALDPAMSRITQYWVWGGDGPYYGMPWLNLFGWFVTGLVLMGVLLRLDAPRWLAGLDRRWAAAYYAANLALPLGMCVAAGYWGAVLTTLAGLGLCALLRELLDRHALDEAALGHSHGYP